MKKYLIIVTLLIMAAMVGPVSAATDTYWDDYILIYMEPSTASFEWDGITYPGGEVVNTITLAESTSHYFSGEDGDVITYIRISLSPGDTATFSITTATGTVKTGTVYYDDTTLGSTVFDLTLDGQNLENSQMAVLRYDELFRIASGVYFDASEGIGDNNTYGMLAHYSHVRTGEDTLIGGAFPIVTTQLNEYDPIKSISISSSEGSEVMIVTTPYDDLMAYLHYKINRAGGRITPAITNIELVWNMINEVYAFFLGIYFIIELIIFWFYFIFVEHFVLTCFYVELVGLTHSAYRAARRRGPDKVIYFFKYTWEFNEKLYKFLINVIKTIIEIFTRIVSAIGSLLPFT